MLISTVVFEWLCGGYSCTGYRWLSQRNQPLVTLRTTDVLPRQRLWPQSPNKKKQTVNPTKGHVASPNQCKLSHCCTKETTLTSLAWCSSSQQSRTSCLSEDWKQFFSLSSATLKTGQSIPKPNKLPPKCCLEVSTTKPLRHHTNYQTKRGHKQTTVSVLYHWNQILFSDINLPTNLALTYHPEKGSQTNSTHMLLPSFPNSNVTSRDPPDRHVIHQDKEK